MSYKYCPHCGEQLPPEISKRKSEDVGEAVPTYVKREVTSGVKSGGVEIEKIDVYNQDHYWDMLVKEAEDYREHSAAGFRIERKPDDLDKSLIHLVFDKPVAPRGGLMCDLVRSVSATQPPLRPRMSRNDLEAMRYVVDDEGKVVLVDGVPISPLYSVLQYWGGEKQHKRWHLAEPIHVDPQRKGNPCFIDDSFACFSARWKDGDKVEEAVGELVHLLTNGIKDMSPPGLPRLVDVYWLR